LFVILSWVISIASAQVAYDPNSIPGWGRSQCDLFALSPYDIILDRLDSQTMPNNFRSPTFLKPAKHQTVDLKGFNSLRISGSGQFSEGQFKEMLAHLKRTHKVEPEHVIVIDLREEPHAYINGHAVTWYYGPLSYQQGKIPESVMQEEQSRLTQLKAHEHAMIYTILKHEDGMPLNKKPRHEKIQTLKEEAEMVKQLGARYIRLPVTDHFHPENQDVDQFLEIMQTLKPTDWLHFKCRGGKGRTTTFMAMYDMIKNPGLKKEDFLKRQTLIDGIDLTYIPKGKKLWKQKLGRDRIQFLATFYDYVHAVDGYGKMRWTDWVLKHIPDAYHTFQVNCSD
jgi:cell fate (sporulation/competence/biofilm development) regulator YmcA (YheA/YmcA/DUF963 family)